MNELLKIVDDTSVNRAEHGFAPIGEDDVISALFEANANLSEYANNIDPMFVNAYCDGYRCCMGFLIGNLFPEAAKKWKKNLNK